jgi:hypothetical protein
VSEFKEIVIYELRRTADFGLQVICLMLIALAAFCGSDMIYHWFMNG